MQSAFFLHHPSRVSAFAYPAARCGAYHLSVCQGQQLLAPLVHAGRTTYLSSPRTPRRLLQVGIADLVEGVNQGLFVVGLERNVKVDRGAGGRVPWLSQSTFQECFMSMWLQRDDGGVAMPPRGRELERQRTASGYG